MRISAFIFIRALSELTGEIPTFRDTVPGDLAKEIKDLIDLPLPFFPGMDFYIFVNGEIMNRDGQFNSKKHLLFLFPILQTNDILFIVYLSTNSIYVSTALSFMPSFKSMIIRASFPCGKYTYDIPRAQMR